MPRKINEEFDREVYDYLSDNHTYKQTSEHFSISEMQVSRIKKRIEKSDTQQSPDKQNQSSKPIRTIKPLDTIEVLWLIKEYLETRERNIEKDFQKTETSEIVDFISKKTKHQRLEVFNFIKENKENLYITFEMGVGDKDIEGLRGIINFSQIVTRFSIPTFDYNTPTKTEKNRELLISEINKVKPNGFEIEHISEDLSHYTLKEEKKTEKIGISLTDLKLLVRPKITVRKISGVYDLLFNETIQGNTKEEMLENLISKLQLEHNKLKNKEE